MAAAIAARPELIQNDGIPYRNVWKKALICVPIVGLIASSIFEMDIELQIQYANMHNPRRLFNLITLKNQYKKCIIVSSVLTIITSVALAAMHLFPVYHTATFSLLLAALIYQEILWIRENNLKLTEIENRMRIPRQDLLIQ